MSRLWRCSSPGFREVAAVRSGHEKRRELKVSGWVQEWSLQGAGQGKGTGREPSPFTEKCRETSD